MQFLKNIGTTEIIIVAVVILVLFGGKKMNEWAKGLGETGRELKKVKSELNDALDETKKEVEK